VDARSARALDGWAGQHGGALRGARSGGGGDGNGEGSRRKDRVSPARRELGGGSTVNAGWGRRRERGKERGAASGRLLKLGAAAGTRDFGRRRLDSLRDDEDGWAPERSLG
jgi:hypothetical protein